jgi:hypothetical protein
MESTPATARNSYRYNIKRRKNEPSASPDSDRVSTLCRPLP